jgi:PEP-CTERM motif
MRLIGALLVRFQGENVMSIKYLALAAVSAIALSTPAYATLDVAFSDGTSTVTCADQTACDLDGAAKNLLLINTIVGDFRITGTFAESTTGNLSFSNLTIFNNGPSTGTLDMVVGDTDFAFPVTGVRESGSLTFNEGIGSSGTLSFFADAANGQPAGSGLATPGTLLDAFTDIVDDSPDSFAGTHDSAFVANGPFSMTEAVSLTMVAGSNITGFNQAMQTTVPEPSTWAMLGLGFGFMAFAGMKRRKNRLVSI